MPVTLPQRHDGRRRAGSPDVPNRGLLGLLCQQYGLLVAMFGLPRPEVAERPPMVRQSLQYACAPLAIHTLGPESDRRGCSAACLATCRFARVLPITVGSRPSNRAHLPHRFQ